MQLFPLLLIVIVLAADSGARLFGDHVVSPEQSALVALLGPAVIVAGAWMIMAICGRRLSHGGGGRSLLYAERAMRYGRMLLLINHAVAVLAMNWLAVIRSVVGDLILLDELLAVLPPLVGVVMLWWAYYPIERRVRDALLLRRLDLGKPVYPTPSRTQYVMLQFRTGVLVLLAPVLVILAIGETINMAAQRYAEAETAEAIANVATLIAAGGVFVCAPLLMRLLLHVQPLPQGELRDDLMEICRRHGVRVRELLLWKTSGSMINAAVMGLIGPLRYVLVTDALIETMTRDQLKAVMAHEVGHVRRHHMPWLVICFAAALLAVAWLIELPLIGLDAAGKIQLQEMGDWLTISLMAGQLVLGLVAFGWISRRFERQADTFAVQHLSGLGDPEGEAEGHGCITPDAVHAMCSALEMIAQLNAVDPKRPSWRHGSIAWRQRYLLSIVGQPLNRLPIDRNIKHIKRIAGLVLIATIGVWAMV